MNEIQDLLGRTWQADCIGCAVSSKEMDPPGGLISQSDSFCLHQDPEIPIPGFLIISSKRHIRSFNDMSSREQSDFASLLSAARSRLAGIPEIESVTIVQEERSAHFHAWLFPWYPWMTDRFGPNSLTHLRRAMAYARSHRNTPEQVNTILKCVEKLKQHSR